MALKATYLHPTLLRLRAFGEKNRPEEDGLPLGQERSVKAEGMKRKFLLAS